VAEASSWTELQVGKHTISGLGEIVSLIQMVHVLRASVSSCVRVG
jgi:hypothetical protein